MIMSIFSRWCIQRELQLCDGQWRSSLHTSTAHWIWRRNILHEVPLLIFLSCYKWDLLKPIGQHQCTKQLDWRTECQLPYMAVRQQYEVCFVHFYQYQFNVQSTTHVECTYAIIAFLTLPLPSKAKPSSKSTTTRNSAPSMMSLAPYMDRLNQIRW